MSKSFPLLYVINVVILQKQFHIGIDYAPVAQGIEHRPPEAGAAVRIRPGVYFFKCLCMEVVFMEGRRKDCTVKSRRNKVFLGIALLFLMAVTVLGNLTKEKPTEAQKTNAVQVKVKNTGCEKMESNPLETGKYPGIINSVDKYYRTLEEKNDFVESYDNIKIYTKLGKYKDTYVVFARYDMKIKDIYTKVPGLGTLLVQKGKDGKYFVDVEKKSQEIQSYVREIAEHEDVKTLIAETQEAYQAAVASDALLQEALEDLKNAYESSTGS